MPLACSRSMGRAPAAAVPVPAVGRSNPWNPQSPGPPRRRRPRLRHWPVQVPGILKVGVFPASVAFWSQSSCSARPRLVVAATKELCPARRRDGRGEAAEPNSRHYLSWLFQVQKYTRRSPRSTGEITPLECIVGDETRVVMFTSRNEQGYGVHYVAENCSEMQAQFCDTTGGRE